MNPTAQNAFSNDSASRAVSGTASDTAEATLRLIAKLPAPAGLEDRVHAELFSGSHPARRSGRVLRWPSAVRPGSDWMRGAAAAAIVFLVAGGGWGIYSHVQRPQSSSTVIALPHEPAQGGFSNAGAMRTPKTLNGPVLTSARTLQPLNARIPRSASIRLRRPQSSTTDKVQTQPVAVPAN
jgi:hypothetical protein